MLRPALQVFAAAATVMALELCGPRLLAPAFGNGTVVWSAVLAATLVAMGAGNLVGGRLADRGTWQGPARWALLLGAVAAALAAGVAGRLGDALSLAFPPTPAGQLAALLLTAGLLFGPPSALLAALYPLAFRGALRDVERAGRTAGALYAASALGSLLGALAPPLWGVPVLGTRATLWAFAALPALAAGWPTALAATVLLALALASPEALPEGLERWESAVTVYSIERRGDARLLREEVQGRPVLSVDPPDYTTLNSYYDELVLARGFGGGSAPSRVLILGHGGGTVEWLALSAWPQAEIHAVELDATLVERTRPIPGTTVHVGDGRALLRRLPGPWDLVIVDVSTGGTPPPHLSSREFMAEVRARLSPAGVAAVYAPPPLNVQVYGSMAAAFPHALMLEHTAVGAETPLDPEGADRLARRLGWDAEGPLAQRVHRPPGGAPITDDRGGAPWWWGMRIQ